MQAGLRKFAANGASPLLLLKKYEDGGLLAEILCSVSGILMLAAKPRVNSGTNSSSYCNWKCSILHQ